MALLGNIFGGNTQHRGGMSTLDMALMGVLAYRTIKGKGRLADMLGTAQPAAGAQPGTPASSQAGGGLGGLLSSLGGLGGLAANQGAGNAISDGLRNLMNRFEQNGQGDKVHSW